MPLYAKVRNRLYRFLVSLSNPTISNRQLALGFGLGTFIAVLPTPGFGVLIGIFLVFLFKRINKYTMLFSFAVWNPLILTPIYLLSYKIGSWLFNPEIKTGQEAQSFLSQALVYCKTYLFGNALLAVVLSVASYFIVLKIADAYKQRRILKRQGSRTS